MLPLSEELAQALGELETSARLHQTSDESDMGVWGALVVVRKAVAALAHYEAVPGAEIGEPDE